MEQTSLIFSIETIQYLVNYASYFIFSFIGSILKEIYNTNSDAKHEFDPYRVVTSTIVASLAALAVKEYFKETLDQYWGIMGIISLILGFVGFELFHHISSIRALNKFIKGIKTEEEVEPVDYQEMEREQDTRKYPSLHSNPKHLVDYRVQKPIIHHPNESKDPDDEEDKK